MTHATDSTDDLMARLTSGRVYDLGTSYEAGMPVHPAHPPYVFAMQRRHGDLIRPGPYSSANEMIVLCAHTGTHLDALGHVSEGGIVHGGLDAGEVQQGGRGLKVHGIENVAPVLRRGVLLDVAGAEGVDVLPADFAVSGQMAQDIAASQGVEVRAGDAVLFRTGWMRYWNDPTAFLSVDQGLPGPNGDAGEWLAERKVFLGGSDTVSFEIVVPGAGMPVHIILLMRNGIHILENAVLDDLARDKVYEFALAVAPLKFVGATGSPVRPIAIA